MRDKNEAQINENIRDREIRLLGPSGEQLGMVSSREAQQMAYDQNLDLVKIAPKAKPPVCKIMDYGKHKYELAKKEKEAKKKQKNVVVKEMRLSAKIESHDLNVKANTVSKFLENGDKVKISLRFRGREMNNTMRGRAVMQDFAKLLEEISVMEKTPRLEGRQMIMILTPKNV
ncbi:MAG: translation initiation factor IF-3 [Alkaliphilus sp.]|nr:translation initiation factor IF-3 [bacterium AH-315-K05]PHS28916.1 MAG: translation initiation factor IF-3 [Alkaliphilus sp.]